MSIKLTELADISMRRGRRLERQLNTAASFTFTVDGRSDVAKLIREMETDVVVWRTDDRPGAKEVMYGRFIVAQSEDVITTDAHSRRVHMSRLFRHVGPSLFDEAGYLYRPGPKRHCDLVTATSHDRPYVGRRFQIVYAGFIPPLHASVTAPDGGPGAPGPARDRTYTAQSSIGQLITDLSAVIGNTPGDRV